MIPDDEHIKKWNGSIGKEVEVLPGLKIKDDRVKLYRIDEKTFKSGRIVVNAFNKISDARMKDKAAKKEDLDEDNILAQVSKDLRVDLKEAKRLYSFMNIYFGYPNDEETVDF